MKNLNRSRHALAIELDSLVAMACDVDLNTAILLPSHVHHRIVRPTVHKREDLSAPVNLEVGDGDTVRTMVDDTELFVIALERLNSQKLPHPAN